MSPTIRWCSSRRAQILSGGNFHAEPVAFAADKIAVVLAEIGNLSERRMALLTDSSQSSLPAFLSPNPGLNSGFMIPQVVSAALATENKHLANAVATDTVPTCANQEDHVSLATYAARRLHLMADNLARLLAVEIMAAAQGDRAPPAAPLERCPGAGRGHRARGLRIPRRRPSAGRRDRGGGRHGACWSLPSMSPVGRSGPLASEMRMPEILKANNRAWAARKVAADPDFFKRLEGQQAPEYLWIGCSDSRVPANEIVGLDPGELFVHRNVANLAPPQDANYLSVLQFAVDVLKVKHIMVVGHYGCGGVAAAVDGKRRGLVDHWLHPIREVYQEHRHELEAIPDEQAPPGPPVRAQRHPPGAATSPPTSSSRTPGRAARSCAVHGWVYSLANGLVNDLGFRSRPRLEAPPLGGPCRSC